MNAPKDPKDIEVPKTVVVEATPAPPPIGLVKLVDGPELTPLPTEEESVTELPGDASPIAQDDTPVYKLYITFEVGSASGTKHWKHHAFITTRFPDIVTEEHHKIVMGWLIQQLHQLKLKGNVTLLDWKAMEE